MGSDLTRDLVLTGTSIPTGDVLDAARYGRCRVCGRKKALRVNGTIGEHRLHDNWQCTGGGLPPKDESEDA